MTRFLDGPAAGQTLMLKRAPFYLRVTQTAIGKEFDALDQPGDAPRVGEDLFAYHLKGEPGTCHINGGKSSGWYALAEYVCCDPQPTDAQMRTEAEWAAWCSGLSGRKEAAQFLELKRRMEGEKPSDTTAWSVTPARDGKPEERVPYVPPVFPERHYYIVERETGVPLLDCGGRGRLLDREPAGRETRYRRLKNPHDWIHATPMTAEEARTKAAAWGLDKTLFKITNQKPTKPTT